MKTIHLYKPARQRVNTDISVKTHYYDNDVTGIEIDAYTSTGVFSAKGSSKRDPQDKPNSEIAELLALSRALKNLSTGLERRANGLIKNAADLEEYRKQQDANKFSRQFEYEYKKIEEAKSPLQRIATRRNPLRRLY